MARSRKPVSCLRANAETGSKANSVSDSAAYLGGIGVTKRIALPELPVKNSGVERAETSFHGLRRGSSLFGHYSGRFYNDSLLLMEVVGVRAVAVIIAR